jgi:hypothetical protein
LRAVVDRLRAGADFLRAPALRLFRVAARFFEDAALVVPGFFEPALRRPAGREAVRPVPRPVEVFAAGDLLVLRALPPTFRLAISRPFGTLTVLR